MNQLKLDVEYIKERCAAEALHLKKNFFLLVPVFLGIGIAVYFALKSEPSPYMTIGVTLLWLFLGASYIALKKSIINDYYLYIFLATALVFIGFTAAQIRTIYASSPVIKSSIGPVNIDGTIGEIDYLPGEKCRIYLNHLLIENIPQNKTPENIRLHYRNCKNFTSGQNIIVLAQLHPPARPSIPGGFDFQRYAYFEKIGAVGFIYKILDIPQQEHTAGQPSFIHKIREGIGSNIRGQTTPRIGAIISALLIGEKHGINDSDVQAIRDAGLAHLLAISGLHLGIVTGTIFFLIRLFCACCGGLALKYPIKKYAALIAIMTGVFYMLIAGSTIPTQRAAIMTGLFFTAIIFDRSPISLRFVVFAALIILCIAPESLLSVSFQMSFAAVAALVCFYESFAPQIKKLHSKAGILKKILIYFAGVIVTSLIASAVTALFSLYHFQHVSLAGIFSNLIAIPLMAFWIMPLGLISILLMPLGLSAFTLDHMGQGVDLLLSLAHFTASNPYASFDVPAFDTMTFTCFLAAILCLAVFSKRVKLLAVIPLAIGLIAYNHNNPADILLSEKMKLWALYAQEHNSNNPKNTAYFSSLRHSKYTSENWARYWGAIDNIKSTAENIDINCDDLGCRTQLKGKKISIVKSPEITRTECNWADLVISEQPIKNENCNTLHIDFFDSYYRGAHGIWINDEGIAIHNANDVRGKRPWVF